MLSCTAASAGCFTARGTLVAVDYGMMPPKRSMSVPQCSYPRPDWMQSGYPCLSLHGGKDQSDRESTIADFKSDVCNVLIATSVAARGLDVKDLVRCAPWAAAYAPFFKPPKLSPLCPPHPNFDCLMLQTLAPASRLTLVLTIATGQRAVTCRCWW